MKTLLLIYMWNQNRSYGLAIENLNKIFYISEITTFTMSLTEKIAGDLIIAMKEKDKTALDAIRAAKTAFLLVLIHSFFYYEKLNTFVPLINKVLSTKRYQAFCPVCI